MESQSGGQAAQAESVRDKSARPQYKPRLLERASKDGGGGPTTARGRADSSAKKGGLTAVESPSIAIGDWLGQEEPLWQVPTGHRYPLLIIQLAIGQVMGSLTSLRGVQQTFELFAQYWALPTPSFSSIRRWVLRLGLYELQRERDYRNDWIYILDLTIELGAAKCLVILGISKFRWQVIVEQAQRGLRHQDVEVLELQVLPSSSGKVIEQVLRDLSKRVGPPVQILSDHGNDVKKGVELYLADHREGIYTYDVTHWLALQLKAELEPDERYQSFVKQCHQCRAQLQQTELSELMPPSQRTKARYFNVDRLVNWGQQILKYQQDSDFSRLSNEFILDAHTLEVLAPVLETPVCQHE
jgi:hypothetical protein